ncbi:MAG: 50S ribosomal protein L4 [Candidatus Nanoarchaeia archaeon]
MKVPVFSVTGEKISEVELPRQFSEELRPDLIKRAALAVLSNQHQPYGTDPMAGKRQGKAWPKRRRKFGTTYSKGISRVARKALWSRGEQFGWVGARGAQTVKGIKAFPPKVEKVFWEKINKKEKKKAIRSALAATVLHEYVSKIHKIEPDLPLPLVIEERAEELSKTTEIYKLLKKLGLSAELKRTKEKKIRAGKGKLRGRKYKTKVGPLIIVSKLCKLEIAARNLVGVDVCEVRNLNAALLAPGTQPARLTIWTLPALKLLEKEALFE